MNIWYVIYRVEDRKIPKVSTFYYPSYIKLLWLKRPLVGTINLLGVYVVRESNSQVLGGRTYSSGDREGLCVIPWHLALAGLLIHFTITYSSNV